MVILIQKAGTNPFHIIGMVQDEPQGTNIRLKNLFHGTALIMAQQFQGQDDTGGGPFPDQVKDAFTTVSGGFVLFQFIQDLERRILIGEIGLNKMIHMEFPSAPLWAKGSIRDRIPSTAKSFSSGKEEALS